MNKQLTPEDLQSIVQAGEGYNAEFKIRVPKKVKEISNPGGLTSAISWADFGTKSHSRNPLIFGLFVRIHMVEQVGSGIGRIRDEMKSAKLPEPQFKTDGMFTVALHRTVEETVGIILNAMRVNPKVTAKELQEKTGLTRRGVEYHLDKLKKENKIERVGSTKAGYWKVKP